MAEPYSAWFNALVAALVDATGPFKKSAQVEWWDDVGLDDLLPDERMIQALTRSVPQMAHCLISWTPGGADPRVGGGGNTHHEAIEFTVRYACGAPGKDYKNAFTADGTQYYGAFTVHDWILDAVLQLEVAGFDTPATLVGASGIRLEKPGVIGNALRFSVARLRVYSD